MFRLSRLLKQSGSNNGRHEISAARGRSAPVVIWNLTNACNLTCLHCYASSTPEKFNSELSHGEAMNALDGLAEAGVKFLILSGGEPLMRKDVRQIAHRAKELGMFISLSSNGTLINESTIGDVAECMFDYVGVSVDGSPETHDRVRGMKGAFDKSMRGIKLLQESGVKTGLRFTMTNHNIDDLPGVFSLTEELGCEKIYLSHLAYTGRGDQNKSEDVPHARTRQVMEYVFGKAQSYIDSGTRIEIVTGNNDADGAFLTLWLMERDPEAAERLFAKLEKTGGNSAGIGISNIDYCGFVHPDPYTKNITLGNVKEAPFGELWYDSDHEALKSLRRRPRKLHGRCEGCRWINTCGGNNRERALSITGDFWGSDPACYLTDEEIEVELAHIV